MANGEKKNSVPKFFFLLCVVFALVLLSASLSEARSVYVCLSKELSQFSVATDGELFVVDSEQKKYPAGHSATFRKEGSRLVWGKKSCALPVQFEGSGLLRYNSRSYRGVFLLSRQGFLVNVLDLEDYIKGVLPAEVGKKWPLEALKVQAIISRTYALRQSLNRANKGYDVVDTVSDQVYRGAGVESSETNRAVGETTGKVLAYGSELAFTPFHSDSGGHTADNADVWGKDLPYLKGVAEAVSYQSPNSTWTARISAAQVEQALAKIGGSVGTVSEIRAAELGPGGRTVSLQFVGSSGSKAVKASLFRMAIGPNLLKSTFLTDFGGDAIPLPARPSFSSQEDEPAVKESEWTPDAETGKEIKAPVPTSDTPMTQKQEARLTQMTTEGVFSTDELMDMLMNPNKRKGYLYLAIQRGEKKALTEPDHSTVPVPPQQSELAPARSPILNSRGVLKPENGTFLFNGRGWGHGVGLSQWGMLALANQGWTAERILNHYYSGTTVKHFK